MHVIRDVIESARDRVRREPRSAGAWGRLGMLLAAHNFSPEAVACFAEAETLAREAVAIYEPTDAISDQGDALCDLAEVLAAAGRSDEAADALEQALKRYERKKNLAKIAQVRPRLEPLQARTIRT